MISVEEAQKIVEHEIPRGPKIFVPLRKSNFRVLADDLFSPVDSPPFNGSAMDGFAIRHEETARATKENPVCFKNMGWVAAGEIPARNLEPGESVHVMTGAMIPANATAVIPQEEVFQENREKLFVSREVLAGEHLRRKGEEIKRGERTLLRGACLTPGSLGFLASLGFVEIPVYAPPRITILPTGSELVRDLAEMGEGKIIESNSVALEAALQELAIKPQILAPVPDIPKVLHAVAEYQLQQSDFVLMTGGVSVGAFDLVKGILENLGVIPLFWGISQKPGKPLFFGKWKSGFVFGLPGNPVSSLVCFYEYVRPAILAWLGYDSIFLSAEKGRLKENFQKRAGRTHFVRAIAQKKNGEFWVILPTDQESHRMKSFSAANCLAVIPSAISEMKSGNEISFHWLPQKKVDE